MGFTAFRVCRVVNPQRVRRSVPDCPFPKTPAESPEYPSIPQLQKQSRQRAPFWSESGRVSPDRLAVGVRMIEQETFGVRGRAFLSQIESFKFQASSLGTWLVRLWLECYVSDLAFR